MECVGITSEVIYKKESYKSVYRSEYSLDLWEEVQKRWLVFGVLFSIMLAVLSPHVGAPGGNERMLLQSLETLHPIAIALFSSVGAPCAWLSLALSRSSAAAACVASSYVLSLLAAPLAMLVLCGRAAIPPIGHTITSLLSTLAPFLLGVSRPAPPAPPAPPPAPQVVALVLLYAEVCARLVEAEGSLYVGDVLTTLCLELCYLSSSAALCAGYARCGLLSPRLAATVAFCALPKEKPHGWEWSPQCGAWGVGSLPSVFRAPAVALLLAAAGDSDEDPKDN